MKIDKARSKAKRSKRSVPEHVRAAADRAEARARGKDPRGDKSGAPIDPPIAKAAEIVEHIKAEKRKRGRPTRYTEAIDQAICARLREGESLSSICRDEDMPSKGAVLEWAGDPAHPFSDHYARAREVGYHAIADEMRDIADDGQNDWIEREVAGGRIITVVDQECVQRSKLRIDQRQWELSHMLPKLYGKKKDEAPSAVDARAAFIACMEFISSGRLPPIEAGKLIEDKPQNADE